MKADIEIPKVEGIRIAIVPSNPDDLADLWEVYIMNQNTYRVDTVLINSKGYGDKDGLRQTTSTMRQMIEVLPGSSYGKFESIDPAVFHLTNEYFVTYYKDGKIYDKNFVFVPETIIKENLIDIELLGKKGVLHD